MRLVINFQHVLHGQLRIALGCRKTLMAEHFLDGTQVCAFFEHVRAEGVAQRVRMHIGREPFCYSDLLDDAAHAASGKPAASLIDQ